MSKDSVFAGLDVHAETTAVAVCVGREVVRSLGEIPSRPEACGRCWSFGKSLRDGTHREPGHCEIRRVSSAGMIRLAMKAIFVSHALENEDVALEEVDDGLWNIVFYRTLLGRYDEREGLITGADYRNLKGN